MGKYFVTPASHQTPCGRFQASFAVQRAKQKGSHCRVFRFEQTFASPVAAKIYAVTQGWLQTSIDTPMQPRQRALCWGN